MDSDQGATQVAKAIFIGFNVAFIIAYGLLANELGSASEVIEIPSGFVAPDGGSFFDKIIAPFVWAFDAAGTFFQIVGISFTAVNPIVTTLVFSPLVFVDIFIIYGMVRGGGT